MSDDDVQSQVTHRRWLPPWHFFAVPVLLGNAIAQIVSFARLPNLDTAWNAVVWIAVLLALALARWMALRNQDRIIRLEETLRLERLLPGRAQDFERLTLDQLIGIRFASDAEVAHLVDRIFAGELVSRGDVKQAVQHWRADHNRI